MIKGGIDVSRLFTPLKYSLPFDQNSTRGWIATVAISIWITDVNMYVNYAFVTFFVSIALYSRAYQRYFEGLVEKMCLNVKERGPDTAHMYLIDAVRFHRSIKW